MHGGYSQGNFVNDYFFIDAFPQLVLLCLINRMEKCINLTDITLPPNIPLNKTGERVMME